VINPDFSCSFTGFTLVFCSLQNLINESHRINSVQASALFIELNDEQIRCSLRSKGAVDVCKIAKKFGGGGHKTASATYLPVPLEYAELLILKEVKRQLEQIETQ